MEPRLRASAEQFAILIEFMERNGDIARPQSGAQGRVRADNLWQELAQTINSVGGGVKKPTEKWKKRPIEARALTINNRVMHEEIETTDTIHQQRTASPPLPQPNMVQLERGPITPPPAPTTPLPAPTTPPPAPRTVSPATSATTPRRQQRRRRRAQTPFDRAASEFVAVEQRRLQLEELRERNFHERELERVRLDMRRVEVDAQIALVLQRLLDVAENRLQPQ